MGAPMPDEAVFLTGAALIAEYLQVLADFLGQSGRCEFKFGTELVSIGRATFLKREHIGANGKRKGAPFRLLLQNAAGEEELMTDCTFLVDCSGTWNQPNWCGAGGVPAVGERRLVKAGRILQHIPDPALAPERFLGKRVCVVGAGASAITSINALQRLASAANASIDLVWVVRRENEPYQRIENDSLPQRDRLYSQGNALYTKAPCEEGGLRVTYLKGCLVHAFHETGDGSVRVDLTQSTGADQRQISHEVDLVISSCGYRPDDTLWHEVQVHQCFATGGPMKLAAALMSSSGGGGDCLAQVSHGPETLCSPEPGMLVIGMKSYGRNSAFLLKIGQQQVDDAMALMTAQINELSGA
eukprot:GHVU01123283.1.p1 GENE.GHVU01123283.1~~GHVU01123283.1.p1  ORF type:complete len:367 (+),score=62.31 GHVU01123283.1:32-1102(+)